MNAAKIAWQDFSRSQRHQGGSDKRAGKIPAAQVRKNAKSRLFSASCLRVEATALGRTNTIEVPTATCISTGCGTPNSGNR